MDIKMDSLTIHIIPWPPLNRAATRAHIEECNGELVRKDENFDYSYDSMVVYDVAVFGCTEDLLMFTIKYSHHIINRPYRYLLSDDRTEEWDTYGKRCA